MHVLANYYGTTTILVANYCLQYSYWLAQAIINYV